MVLLDEWGMTHRGERRRFALSDRSLVDYRKYREPMQPSTRPDLGPDP